MYEALSYQCIMPYAINVEGLKPHALSHIHTQEHRLLREWLRKRLSTGTRRGTHFTCFTSINVQILTQKLARVCLYNDFPDHADFEQVCVRNDSYVDFEHVCLSVLSSQCSLTQRLTYVLPGFTVVYVCVRARCTLARALALALFALSLFLSLFLSLSLSHTHTHPTTTATHEHTWRWTGVRAQPAIVRFIRISLNVCACIQCVCVWWVGYEWAQVRNIL